MRTYIGILGLTLLAAFLFVPAALAATPASNLNNSIQNTSGGGRGFTFENPLEGVNSLGNLIDLAAVWLTNIATPLAVIMIVYAGVRFVLARGNPAEITKARQILQWAVVGLVIVFVSRGLVSLVTDIIDKGTK